MVSMISLVFICISILLALILPVVLMITLWIKYRYDLILIAFGGLGYFLVQIAIKMNLLNYLTTAEWFISLGQHPVLLGILLATVNAVMTEIVRFLVFVFLVKKEDRNWKNGLAFGLGYGGIESIIMTGLAYLSYLGYAIAINNGFLESLVGDRYTMAEFLQIKNDLMQPAFLYLQGGLERTALVFSQMAFSLLVMFGVKEFKPEYLFYAILAQLSLHLPLVLLGQIHQYLSLAWLLIFGIAAIHFMKKAKKELFAE